jgi:hypothetical protein
LREQGESGVPVKERVFGLGQYLRPNFIQPNRCHNVLVEGITIRNSPMWEIHPVLSANVTVRGVTVSSHGPNNDGCDPESSRDVLIEDCIFDTGDDCIAIKSESESGSQSVSQFTNVEKARQRPRLQPRFLFRRRLQIPVLRNLQEKNPFGPSPAGQPALLSHERVKKRQRIADPNPLGRTVILFACRADLKGFAIRESQLHVLQALTD